MKPSPSSLIGSWLKVSTLPCSEAYPHAISFAATGRYEARAASQGTYTHWDVGTFELAEDGHVRISTANDAVVSYRLKLEPRRATFVDPGGCEVIYERA